MKPTLAVAIVLFLFGLPRHAAERTPTSANNGELHRRRLSDAVPPKACPGCPPPTREKATELSPTLTDHFMIVPEHNLLFCYVEKVGCSAFNELFRSLRERYDPAMKIHNWWEMYGVNGPAAYGWTTADLEAVLHNASWHKAVFYREPLERFVSGFRSKCRPNFDRDPIRVVASDGTLQKIPGNSHCVDEFGSKRPSFADAVRHFVQMDSAQSADEQSVDPHWTRQSQFCGGLAATLQYYDTVEELTPGTSRAKVGALLQRVGVADPSSVPAFDLNFPRSNLTVKEKRAQEMASSRGAAHYTHTAHGTQLRVWFTHPAYAQGLVAHYLDDYVLFGISAPGWAARDMGRRPPWAALSGNNAQRAAAATTLSRDVALGVGTNASSAPGPAA